MQELTEPSKQPIRTRHLGHVTAESKIQIPRMNPNSQNKSGEGSSPNGSAEQLLLSATRDTMNGDTSVYPNAEKYFKERVQLFTKTVILVRS